MSEALVGVIIGGTIASLTPVINLYLSEKRWKREAKVSHLEQKRKRLEEAFKGTLDRLTRAMVENFYPSDMMSDFDFLFPREVSEAFESMIKDGDKSELNRKVHFYKISRSMKKSLADLDGQIYNEICQ